MVYRAVHQRKVGLKSGRGLPGGEIEVRIWIAEVGPEAVRLLPALLERLEAGGRTRVLRMVREGDRALHGVAQVLLRQALASAGMMAPRFRRGPHGKPELEAAGAAAALRFNLTHTDGLAACALVRGHEVGVDAEALDRQVDPDALAPSVLVEEERAMLRRSRTPVETFLDLWTVKEAVAKAAGLGLQLPLSSVRVTLDPLRLRFTPELGWDEAGWHVERHRPTPRHSLALALRRPAGWTVAARLHRVRVEDLA
jgi:4'-phosphopantetheinyl transferase